MPDSPIAPPAPAGTLPYALRLLLWRMALAQRTDRIVLTILGGKCQCIKPPAMPRNPDYAAFANSTPTAEQLAVLDVVNTALTEIATTHLNGELIIHVVAGVPQLPLEEAFIQVLPDALPRNLPKARRPAGPPVAYMQVVR